MNIGDSLGHRKRRFVPVWVPLSAALILITLAGAWSWDQYRRANRFRGGTYRIGVGQNPPNYDWPEGRGASGFAVDVLNEAGRRSGVKLEWVYCPRGPMAALESGLIDLWPMGHYRVGEFPNLHQTRSWSEDRHAVVWDRARFAQAPGPMRSGKTDSGAAHGGRESLRAMCAGEVEAAFLDLRAVEGLLLDRPENCRGLALSVKPIPELTERNGLLARKEMGPLAEALRDRIDDMISDGSVTSYAGRWFSLSSSDLRHGGDPQVRWLAGACVAMGLSIGWLVWRVRNLRGARAGADRARQLQSEFLANVSHEIRTPMNGVLGTADLLLDTVSDAEIRDQIETIRESAYGQLELLNQILDQSKIDSGVLLLEMTPFSLRRLVEQVEKTFQTVARRKGLWLRANIPGDLPALVQGDGLRIRQVLTNLVNNALKFTGTGGVEIAVRAVAEGGKVEVEFTVADTGIGIPKMALGTIFEKFRQVDASTTRRYGGMGLGLSISRQLVRLMGGELKVTSEPGRGSEFRFSVTLAAARGAEREKPAANGKVAVLAGLTVLVVEDNLVNQRVAQALLQRLGAEVVLAANGLEAVASCREKDFDVVLMDCHMPEMDGFAATAEIRKLDGAVRTVPIVALTAGVSGEERRKAMQSGMDGFLAKPVNRDELAATLAALPRRETPAA
ncbi:MAG: ATP-binding protein [Bryobacteraceae bacterium]